MFEEVEETYRKSMLDVINYNLQYAERSTYLHRMIYIGSHKCNMQTIDDDADVPAINEIFETIVTRINSEYVDEKLSGLLLYYPAYYSHVIEGSEESIVKHVRLLLEDEDYKQLIEPPKVLIVYHHINQRFFDDWIAISAKPPTLLENIDINSDLEITSRQVTNCVRKLYGLCGILRDRIEEFKTEKTTKPLMPTSALSEESMRVTNFLPTGTTTAYIPCPKLKLTEYLPEYNLLDFLLKTPHTKSLRAHLETYGVVRPFKNRGDQIWPSLTVNVPYNVFDTFEDIIPDLPSRDNVDNGSINTRPDEEEGEQSKINV